jgi:hypothetical protein
MGPVFVVQPLELPPLLLPLEPPLLPPLEPPPEPPLELPPEEPELLPEPPLELPLPPPSSPANGLLWPPPEQARYMEQRADNNAVPSA